MRRLLPLLFLLACGEATPDAPSVADPGPSYVGGKADGADARDYEVLFTDPFCDVCSPADKAWLKERSKVVARVVELMDGATRRLDVAQFTWSVAEIEAALLRAHARGVAVRVAMNASQASGDTVATRLKAAGVDVRFVAGRPTGDFAGLQHAKFMLVDDGTLLTGSNNWSSTGTTINEENTLVVHGATDDPLVSAFACHFEAIWAEDHDGAGACSVDGLVAFSPDGAPVALLRDALRGAERSIDVLMHHLLFDALLKVLAQAAERGVKVRVLVNAADRAETEGRYWDRLRAAGGEIRYKLTNGDAYQLMHHKLAIVDGRVLLNGSGNWSGSALFNNFENYVRYEEPAVVGPFRRTFARLWGWSLNAESLDGGRTAAQQHEAETRILFGNLHAHFHTGDRRDDGKDRIIDEHGDWVHVEVGADVYSAAKHAYEYARDRGGMDFLALTPHVVDDRSDDPPDLPNMTPEGYTLVRDAATEATGGGFVALAGFEWSTNGEGNHLNVLGSSRLAKVERGRFDLLYEGFLPERAAAGDRPLIIFNHPRTHRVYEEYLAGNWDQVFGVNLQELPNDSQRNKKYNDFGLDDYAPLADVRDRWIAGELMPDPAVVAETLRNIEAASRPYGRLMEVTVGRGSELGAETPVNPSLSEDEAGAWSRYDKVHRDFDHYLLHGFRLAPAANHDNHFANWGTGHTTRTAVLAADTSEAGLLDAIDARAVYATEDEDLALRFSAAGRVPMGGELGTLEGRVEATLSFSDPGYVGAWAVRVFRGRVGGTSVEEVQSFGDLEPGAAAPFDLDLPDAGRWFFYVEVDQLDADRMAWSAPIWIERL